MKLRYAAIFLVFSFASTSAWASAKSDCAHYLGVPKRFSSQFKIYRELQYATPLTVVNLDKSKYGTIELRLTSPHRPSLLNPPEVFVKAVLKSENDVVKLFIEEIKMDIVLPPELTWRVVLAHLLEAVPDLNEIHVSFINDSEEAWIRGLLIEGFNAYQAVMQSNVFRAMRGFGFYLKSAKANSVREGKSDFQGEVSISFVAVLQRNSLDF